MKMRPQNWKLMTESLVPRQKSSRKQLQYIKNHQSTSPPDFGRDNIALSSSISIRQCIVKLDLYSNQKKPLHQEVVQAVKNYLNQFGVAKTHERQKWASLHKSQKSLHKVRDFIFRSPYFPDGLLHKQHVFTQKQKENCENYRRNLRKKKMNYENREINLLQHQENAQFKNQENIKQTISVIKNTVHKLRNQLNQLRQEAKATFVKLFNHFQSSFKQLVEQERKKNEQIHLLSLTKLKVYKEKQAEYEQALGQDKQKLLRAQSCKKVLKDYLQQREKELLTIWTTINNNFLSF